MQRLRTKRSSIGGLSERAMAWASMPRDAASLAAFRVLYGVLACVGALRFLVYGWIDSFFVTPTFHFHYWGFDWVQPLGSAGMHAVFAVLAVLGALIALGLFYRMAIVAYVLLFTWAELIDVTNYLNHYYLVSALGLWMIFMPLGQTWGLDARRRGALTSLPRWMGDALRLQVACVYVFAALAKFNTDWLFDAQPLTIWLAARTDLPGFGAWLDTPGLAHVMSWGGFLYDLTIVGWLSWRPTRRFAFAAVIGFHTAVGLLFNIGMFPWIMGAAATLFFASDWPRRLPWSGTRLDSMTGWLTARFAHPMPRIPGLLSVGLLALALVQVAVPLRANLYEGDVLWHEQGMRWSWRVLCREKNGSVSYRVTTAERDREVRVPPSRYLTSGQEREMAGQPDLILQLAHRIAADFRARGETGVEVRVDALASLNGRPLARLIDPEVDLASVSDGLRQASWILPRPEDARAQVTR